MVNERLFEIMGDIDESYVISAMQPIKKKHHFFRYFAAAAACVLLVFAAHNGANSRSDPAPKDYNNSASDKQEYRQVTGYETYGSQRNDETKCYPAPNPGEYYCFQEVNEAREHYKGENVKFILTFDLFKVGETEKLAQISDAELDAEWDRLASLGIEVSGIEHWEYNDNIAEKAVYTGRVCAMTEEQLENFKDLMNPEYGYSFRFVYNGDCSPAADID